MTCIVGCVSDGKVWIGGDSAATGNSEQTILKNRKVFANGKFLIGFTTSFRMGCILQYGFTPPVPTENANIIAFMNTAFIDGVRAAMRSGGYIHVENSVEQGESFLVGYRGHLFRIQSDFSVLEADCGFDACGCGSQIALGAMFASVEETPARRILQALHAAQAFDSAVRPPFVIENIEGY